MKQRLQIPKMKFNEKTRYCTECGEELNDYCFSENSKNLEAVQKNHENCKRTHKFKGDLCSRLFIAQDLDIDEFKD